MAIFAAIRRASMAKIGGAATPMGNRVSVSLLFFTGPIRQPKRMLSENTARMGDKAKPLGVGGAGGFVVLRHAQ